MARVLIVDDSEFLADKIKRFFEAEGHEVVAIGEDGNQGVELYKQHRPDLVTLDITMPNKDGHDCLADIMAFDSTARALMVSAIDDQSVIVNCMNIGAKGFIEKPLRLRDPEFCKAFIETVNEALK